MNEREPNIVLELRDGEVKLVLVLAVLVPVHLLEQLLGERTDQRLLVVIDDLLEKLVDELHFEVGDIETRIVVRIELIGEVQHDFVALALFRRVNEFVHHALADVPHLAVTRDQAVEFELNLIRCIQIRYAFLFVGNENALAWVKQWVRICVKCMGNLLTS